MSDNQMAINDAEESIFVIIDLQDKLAAAMPTGLKDRVVERIGMLLTAANTLSIPVLVTEQYSKGLGHTDEWIADQLPDNAVVCEKTAFCAVGVEEFDQSLSDSNKKQAVLVGMETHICVLQTALGLRKKGYDVFVVEDAVSSRSKANQYNGLQRLRQAGVAITNVESVIFEWLKDASQADFKTLAQLIV